MMLENILVGIGVAVLLLLLLPISSVRKAVLEMSTLVLRLALMALVLAGGIFYFRPDLFTNEFSNAVANWQQQFGGVIAAMSMPLFGATVAGIIVLVLLPLLWVVDLARQLDGERLRRIRALTDNMESTNGSYARYGTAPHSHVRKGADLRSSADAMASAASGHNRPARVSDYVNN